MPSEQNTNREKLAETIQNARTPMGGTLLGSREQFEAVADAILASDWLAAHDREVAAKALEDAAGNWEGAVSRAWLRARAAHIREGNTK